MLASAASMTRRSRIVLRLFVVALVLVPVIALTWPNGYMVSRDIGCGRASDARGREICGALASSMRWTWFGHAIISPGWRITWPGLRDVYCREHVESADVPILERLAQSSRDWRLEDGATGLIRLVKEPPQCGGPKSETDEPRR
jgi:hypothetical protein